MFLNDFGTFGEMATYILTDFREEIKEKYPLSKLDFFVHYYPDIRCLIVILSRTVDGKDFMEGSVLIMRGETDIFRYHRIDLSTEKNLQVIPTRNYDLYLYTHLEDVLELLITHDGEKLELIEWD